MLLGADSSCCLRSIAGLFASSAFSPEVQKSIVHHWLLSSAFLSIVRSPTHMQVRDTRTATTPSIHQAPSSADLMQVPKKTPKLRIAPNREQMASFLKLGEPSMSLILNLMTARVPKMRVQGKESPISKPLSEPWFSSAKCSRAMERTVTPRIKSTMAIRIEAAMSEATRKGG